MLQQAFAFRDIPPPPPSVWVHWPFKEESLGQEEEESLG